MKSKTSAFKKRVYDYYKKNGRHDLPWRNTKDPYKILVSEMMLQQTQVARVIPKYETFIKNFPKVEDLSGANFSQVVRLWSGLGYNRRARMLHNTAKKITTEHSGVFPQEISALEQLPGVGPYTARAVVAFAYSKPVIMIETNIRTVFIHEFSRGASSVSDKEILQLVTETLDTNNPRAWYAALMDYGSYIKRTFPNPSRKSKHHGKQAKFEGSLREVRGKIMRLILEGGKTVQRLVKETNDTKFRVEEALEGLQNDGLVQKNGRKWELAI